MNKLLGSEVFPGLLPRGLFYFHAWNATAWGRIWFQKFMEECAGGGGGRRTSCSVSIEVGHSIHEEWYIIVQRLEVT